MSKMVKNVTNKENTLETLLDTIYEAILFADMAVSLLNKNPNEVYFSDAVIYLKHMSALFKSGIASFLIATKVAVWADEKGTKDFLKTLGE